MVAAKTIAKRTIMITTHNLMRGLSEKQTKNLCQAGQRMNISSKTAFENFDFLVCPIWRMTSCSSLARIQEDVEGHMRTGAVLLPNSTSRVQLIAFQCNEKTTKSYYLLLIHGNFIQLRRNIIRTIKTNLLLRLPRRIWLGFQGRLAVNKAPSSWHRGHLSGNVLPEQVAPILLQSAWKQTSKIWIMPMNCKSLGFSVN